VNAPGGTRPAAEAEKVDGRGPSGFRFRTCAMRALRPPWTPTHTCGPIPTTAPAPPSTRSSSHGRTRPPAPPRTHEMVRGT